MENPDTIVIPTSNPDQPLILRVVPSDPKDNALAVDMGISYHGNDFDVDRLLELGETQLAQVMREATEIIRYNERDQVVTALAIAYDTVSHYLPPLSPEAWHCRQVLVDILGQDGFEQLLEDLEDAYGEKAAGA